MRRLTPRTLFLMPTVSIVGGTSGWFLAVALGYTALPWPDYGWVAAALILVTLMTIQGLGFLTPVNVIVCLELQKAEPDMKKIGALMAKYFYAVALQGTMQVAILIVMTRFAWAFETRRGTRSLNYPRSAPGRACGRADRRWRRTSRSSPSPAKPRRV